MIIFDFSLTFSSTHVYSLVASAYANMIQNNRSQSIVITGESGAGKTTMSRLALKYLASASRGRGSMADLSQDTDSVEQRILDSGPIMEGAHFKYWCSIGGYWCSFLDLFWTFLDVFGRFSTLFRPFSGLKPQN